ncbi:MAG TPA: tetraacyldisaccharide 4'-kinase [Vicinamibacteria bacterium]|nr:tetraacyldisaccharide 4'-kinase [Vicinamibacteria bacterium]
MNARAALAPLGAAYGAAGRLRVLAYQRGLLRRHRLAGAVVSVGNLSLGGSGKTPLVALVARLLQAEGLSVAVLSRGYGGTFDGDALVVSDGQTVQVNASVAGDEPVMLARQLPGVVVAVGRRRDRAGALVEARFGPRVHVLDDGFQHLRLCRDLDLLCVAGADLGDRPLPAGRLRENASAAARASALLVEDEASVPSAAANMPAFTWRRRVEGFSDLGGAPCAAPGRPFLLAAIARPERFAADAAGHAAPVGQAFFRDHHRFSARDLDDVARRAASAGADALLTTAKDAERLPRDFAALPVVVMRVAAVVDDGPRFRALLLAAVGGRA